ncbi:MAG: antitoxin VbhA family protein [Ruminococcus sp.]
MRVNSIDKSIKNAVASVEMEGFHIDEKSKVWCRQLLLNEITMEEYISKVKDKAGVKT